MGPTMDIDARTIRILATIEREQDYLAQMAASAFNGPVGMNVWQGSSDSNRGPSVLETDALTN